MTAGAPVRSPAMTARLKPAVVSITLSDQSGRPATPAGEGLSTGELKMPPGKDGTGPERQQTAAAITDDKLSITGMSLVLNPGKLHHNVGFCSLVVKPMRRCIDYGYVCTYIVQLLIMAMHVWHHIMCTIKSVHKHTKYA